MPGPPPTPPAVPPPDVDADVDAAAEPVWAAVVLAGGGSRRWGGADKTAASLAGRPVLLHAVTSVLPGAAAVVVVGPADHPARAGCEAAVRAAGRAPAWAREQPSGGGPVAGLAAGIATLDAVTLDAVTRAAVPPPGWVLVLAADLPFARTAVPRLLAAASDPDVDAVIGLDPADHPQPLLAAYRLEPLRRRLADLTATGVHGLPMRAVIAGLRTVSVPVSTREAFDLDTPAALGAAEAVLAGPG